MEQNPAYYLLELIKNILFILQGIFLLIFSHLLAKIEEMKKAQLFFTSILVPLDFLMIIGAGLLSYYLRTSSWIVQYRPVLFELNLPFNRYFILIVFVSVFMLLIFALIGLYKIKSIRSFLDDFPKILIGVSAGVMSIVMFVFLRQELFDSRFLVIMSWFLAIFFVALGRFLHIRFQYFLMGKYRFGSNKVLIIGKDVISKQIIKNIKENPSLGYIIIDNLIDIDIKKISDSKIDEVILADPNCSKDKFLELTNFCDEKHIVFKFVPNLYQSLTTNSAVGRLGTVPLIEIKRVALDGWWRIIKRLFDLFFSILFLIIFSFFNLLIYILIKIDSPGPVIYKDYRYGYKKKKFIFYKFRYMKVDLCDGELGTEQGNRILKELENDQDNNIRKQGPLHKIKNDPRVTKLGKFLKKYSIDELPQFFNVIKGDMSLVGYRPHMSYEVEKYTKEQEKMFVAKPGITGLAQISGRSDLDFDEEVKLDIFYIENWSILLDLIIVIKTPFIIIFRKFIT